MIFLLLASELLKDEIEYDTPQKIKQIDSKNTNVFFTNSTSP
jgi:hypothetical protein